MFKFLTVLCLILSSCGFRPVYEENPYNDISNRASMISISPVKNFDGSYGIELRNRLLNRLTPMGKPEKPKYILDIVLSNPYTYEYTVKDDGTASSYLVNMNANFVLKQKDDYKVLLNKTVNAKISYNILKNQFSTEMLKTNAIKLAIEDLSNQIYSAIIMYFTEN